MASPIPSFLTSGDVDTTSYYQTLGVGKQATHEEISKRYKRLALKHHPDKNQGRTTEEFVRIKQAYETLTDPGKRALYDKYGAEGVAWVESSGEGAAQMLPLLKFIVSPFFPLLVCLVSCGFMVLCTISPAFLAAKLNGSAVSWFAVFIPLWIAMLMVVGFMVFKAFAGQEPIATQGDESDSLNEEVRYKSFGQKLQIFAILKIVSLFVFTLLEAIYLSGDGSGPALPFIGIGMFELTSLAKCVASSRKSVYDRLMSAPDAVPWSYTAYVAKNFYWLVFRIIFWVLALLKVVGPMSGASWWIVSIPFFVGAWLDCVVMRQTYNRRMEVVVFMTSSLLDAGHDAEEVEQATAALSGKAQAAFLANCCCWLCAVLAAVMVFLKVETVPKMGGGVMLIPVWLVLSCCCCCVICLNFSVCCARGAATSGGYPDPEAGYSDTSAMHDEDDLTGDSYGAFDATPVVVDDNVKPDVDLVIPDRRDDQAPTNDPANPTGSLWDLD